jgi:hypothetical protein
LTASAENIPEAKYRNSLAAGEKMEDFIGYSVKEKLSTLFSAVFISALAVFLLIEGSEPIAFPLVMLALVFFYIKEKRSVWNKYKIENNFLIIKRFKKMQMFDLGIVEKVMVKGDALILKFQCEVFKIFADKNASKIIEYFFKNNIESIYNKKFADLDESKRLINVDESDSKKHGRLVVILTFIISVLCCIDFIVERTNEFAIYVFIAFFGLLAAIAFVAFILSFRKKTYSGKEDEYIDKDGFHLLNNFIPFSEMSEMAKIVKKWNLVNLKLKTKDNKEYEISTVGFNGDVLYEMYLAKKINK